MKPMPSLLYLREDELNDGIELLFFALRDFGSTADEQLQSAGLGRAHHRALHFIARHPGMPVSDLLSILGITKQSLSRVIKQLVDDSLINLSTGTRDRRQRLLKLTAKGQALESELATLQRNRFAKAYREAGAEAVAGFRQVLTGLLADQERAGVLRLIAKR
jgi:DNA-binding MarR family transcriptional regulator